MQRSTKQTDKSNERHHPQSKTIMPHMSSSTDPVRGSKHRTQSIQSVAGVNTVNDSNSDLDEPVPTSRQHVFETTELLENIISFLPMKKIFNVQRVSKYWKDVIETSPRIQEKMFVRLKIKPKQTVKPHILGWSNASLLLYGRSLQTVFTLAEMNPELRYGQECRMPRYGMTCIGHGRKVVLLWGPAQIRQNFSFLDTYITDPPCKRAEVCLKVSFKHEGTMYPISIIVKHVLASSEAGLTFQDVLRAALNARGLRCSDELRASESYLGTSDTTLREAIGLFPEYLKIPALLDCPVMQAKLVLLDDIATPTPMERVDIAMALRREGAAK